MRSQGQYALTATAVDGLALFAGGTEQAIGYTYGIVDIWERASGQWSTASLSEPRCYFAATSAGHQAIFAGGALSYYADTFTATVDIYNAQAESWSTAALSQARNRLSAVSWGARRTSPAGSCRCRRAGRT